MAEANGQDSESRLDAAVLQFIEARTRGEAPDIDEFVRQYPGLEEDIRRRIASFGRVDSLFDLVKQTNDSDFTTEDTGRSLIGKQIAGFRIIEIIGQGGMGIVYKAQDTRLDRFVAVKTMPAHLLEDEAAQARFRREAKLLASLNHPHIAAIHDIVEFEEGVCHLILEYVPGRTLGEHMANKPLEVREALTIAQQIAEALSSAYEKGVIHRDLKPGNIKITPDENIKILDFGIAKAFGPSRKAQETAVTQEGRLVGTPAYMSPEQTRDKNVDHRSDVWSFGCVLYEMLTGHLAFEGETISDTISLVLQREPDWTQLPQELPHNIRVLLRRCLEKDPKLRLQHVGDAVVEIHETLDEPEVAPPVGSTLTSIILPAAKHQRNWLKLASIAVVVLLLGIVIKVLLRKPSSKPPQIQPVHFGITLPQSQQIGETELWTSKIVLSPDGSRIVYVASQDGINQLFVREWHSMAPRLIPNTEDAHSPIFLPDSNWVVFFTPSKLKKVSLESGIVLTISLISMLSHGGCWSAKENALYFTLNPSSGLFKLTTNGDGKPIPVTHPDKAEGEQIHTQPCMLPGGRALLFTIVSYEETEKREIALLSLDTNQWHKLGIHGSNAHYVEYEGRDYVVYAGVDNLLAVPFDLKQGKVIGPEVRVTDDVITGPAAHFSLANNGTLIYAPKGTDIAKNSLVWVNMQGEKTPLPLTPDIYHGPRLSPDGSRLALVKTYPNCDVYVCELARPSLTKITNNPFWDLWPIWEPTGGRITCAFFHKSNMASLFSIAPDGSDEHPLTRSDPGVVHLSGCWSKDRKHLAFIKINADINELPTLDIWVLNAAENREEAFLATPFNEKMPAFHPSGKSMAYVSDESGRCEVYLRRFPGADDRRQISFDRGDEPVWDPSGQQLFYRSGNTMKVVNLEDEASFTFSAPQDLFKEWFDRNYFVANYDYDAENRRFIMSKPLGEETIPVQINVVLNWFEELKRLVPEDVEK